MRYQVKESKVWVNSITGQKVSPFGACPWFRESDRIHWQLVSQGYTIYDSKTNTYGMGRPPMPEHDAKALADEWNTPS